MKLEWSADALADLNRFAIFLGKHCPSLSTRVAGEIIAKSRVISERPTIGRPIEERAEWWQVTLRVQRKNLGAVVPRWEFARQMIAAIAPIMSFFVVIGSAAIAWTALQTQRELARKKAAIDFFLKTELDSHSNSLWSDYIEAVEKLSQSKSAADFIENNKDDCRKIDLYLNIFELIACGVKTKILDETITRNYYESTFIEQYAATEFYIKEVRQKSTTWDHFVEFKNLTRSWRKGNRLSDYLLGRDKPVP